HDRRANRVVRHPVAGMVRADPPGVRAARRAPLPPHRLAGISSPAKHLDPGRGCINRPSVPLEEEAMHAFVLIQADPGPESLAASLRAIPSILRADTVSGAFDAIVLVQAPSVHELMQDVVARIVALPGVRRALPAPLIGSSAEATVAIASVVAA